METQTKEITADLLLEKYKELEGDMTSLTGVFISTTETAVGQIQLSTGKIVQVKMIMTSDRDEWIKQTET